MSNLRLISSVYALAMVAAIPSANSTMTLLPNATVHESNQMCSSPSASMLLNEVGVTPETLAAIGVSANQVEAMCLAARVFCESRNPSYEVLLTDVEQLRNSIQDLSTKIGSGSATREDLISLRQSAEVLESLRYQIDVFAAEFHTTLSSVLNPSQIQALDNIALARSVDLPVVQKVVARTDSEWIEVRERLARATDDGTELEDDQSEVTVAKVMFEACIASVEQQWQNAMR